MTKCDHSYKERSCYLHEGHEGPHLALGRTVKEGGDVIFLIDPEYLPPWPTDPEGMSATKEKGK